MRAIWMPRDGVSALGPLLGSLVLTALLAAVVLLGGPLVGAGPAKAADRNGEFSSRGLGIFTCQTYLEDRAGNTETYLFYRSWLNGYLSAYNQFRPETFDISAGAPIEQLADAMAQICEAEPQRPFWAAASRLTRLLDDRRQTVKPELVNLTAGDNAVTVSKEQVRRVQQALKDRGYQVGVVDGLYGGNTRRALEAYQQSEALPVTGLPDAATVAKLLQ
ncbi:peptidoglycan-binding protein [Pelagibius sp.]|uniref:peptidoglycan-binding protein n=1 Tax=Pelagibius sp. TaxID=1931238 RepID=UPI003B50DC77